MKFETVVPPELLIKLFNEYLEKHIPCFSVHKNNKRYVLSFYYMEIKTYRIHLRSVNEKGFNKIIIKNTNEILGLSTIRKIKIKEILK